MRGVDEGVGVGEGEDEGRGLALGKHGRRVVMAGDSTHLPRHIEAAHTP